MALEIARVLPRQSRVLDVGCGNGYIAHHLSGLLGSSVVGIDLAPAAEAPIKYRQFDSVTFPVASKSVDAILLCYVLHHAQDMGAVMSELHRVLTRGGVVVVYEDIPETWWDRLVCAIHDRKWRNRTGACRFRATNEWQRLFTGEGFATINQRRLSRWRNLAHPVRRDFYLFKLDCRGGTPWPPQLFEHPSPEFEELKKRGGYGVPPLQKVLYRSSNVSRENR